MTITKEELQKIKQEKLATLKRAFKNIDKITGVENSVYILKDRPLEKVEAISTGSLTLDCALGIGGIPRGRIVECSGLESSGKSLLALRTIAQAQANNMFTAYIDIEQTFDRSWAQLQGVNVDDLIVSQPTTMEQAFKIVTELVNTKVVDLIVIDSIGALLPEQELEDAIEKQHMALIARGLSKFLRIINPLCAQNNCTLFCINQVRATMNMYGPAYTTTGGHALRFYCSVRMEASKVSGSTIKEKVAGEDTPISHEIKVKITKSKVAPPFRTAVFRVYYDGRKVDTTDELANVIINNNLIPKYNSKGEQDINGRKYIYNFEDEHLEINKKADFDERDCVEVIVNFGRN